MRFGKELLSKICKLLKLHNKNTKNLILKIRAKDLNKTSTNNKCKWKISIWKDAPYRISPRKCNLNQQWYTTIYIPIRMANILKHWQHQKLAMMWRKRDSHTLLVRTQNGITTLMVSYKTKFLSYDPAIKLLDIHPRELKTYVHIKILNMDVYRSFVHNCPNLEVTRMSYIR